MRQYLSSTLQKLKQRTGFHWGGGEIILVGILIFGILSLGSGMFGKWFRSSRGGGFLLFDLHSFSDADYGVDEMPIPVPVIGLEIIQDLLGLSQPPETGRPLEIALATPASPSPTSTLPWSGRPPVTLTPQGEESGGGTASSEPRDTSPPGSGNLPTSTATPQPPTATGQPFSPTSTPIPTATKQPSPAPPAATSTPQAPTAAPATNTPLPTPVPATNTPNPSPTPQTQNSPTPRPTRSSTLAVTPTAKYTPIPSPEPPIFP